MLWLVLNVDDIRLFEDQDDAIEYALECGFDEDFPEEIEIERRRPTKPSKKESS